MPSYKLTYFNGMGRAEVTRLLFALDDVKYEDVRLDREKWQELKPKTPFGQMPILEADGEMLCQGKAMESLVANRTGRGGKSDMEKARCLMIVECASDTMNPVLKTFSIKDEAEKKEAREKFCKNELQESLQKLEKLLSPSGYFIGNDITWADLSVFQMISALPVLDYITVDLSKCPKLAALMDKIKGNKNIAAWLAKRPKTPF